MSVTHHRQNPFRMNLTYVLHISQTPFPTHPAYSILLDSIITIFVKQYNLHNWFVCNSLMRIVTSYLLAPKYSSVPCCDNYIIIGEIVVSVFVIRGTKNQVTANSAVRKNPEIGTTLNLFFVASRAVLSSTELISSWAQFWFLVSFTSIWISPHFR
jgi:hypothetical protein